MSDEGWSKGLAEIARVLASALTEQPVLAFVGLMGAILSLAVVPMAIALDEPAAIWLLPVFLIVVLVIGVAAFERQVQRKLTIPVVVADGRSGMQLAHDIAPRRRAEITDTLIAAAASVADPLGIDAKHVRANIFALDTDGKLRIVPEFSHNMTSPQELSIAFAPNQGVAGAAFQQGRLVFARYTPKWGQYAIPDEELAKADPRLTWIVSYPVEAGGRRLWTVNIDGIEDEVSEGALTIAVGKLASWFYLVSLMLSMGVGEQTKG